MATIYTIGYGGKDQQGFLTILTKNNIDTLIDVREYPVSRKIGFSLKTLSDACNHKNIEYIHLRKLGSPYKLRKKFLKDNDFNYFKKHFEASFKSRKELLITILRDLETKRTCLMCLEPKPARCHRSILAQEIVSLSGGEVLTIHL
jgi:uncharacterized protein (DUF488 family)